MQSRTARSMHRIVLLLALVGSGRLDAQFAESTIPAVWVGAMERMRMGDIDGNGQMDFVFLTFGPSGYDVWVSPNAAPNAALLSNFSLVTSLTALGPTFQIHWFALSDFDGDGDDDIVISGRSPTALWSQRQVWAILSGPTPTTVLVATVTSGAFGNLISPLVGTVGLADTDGNGVEEIVVADNVTSLTPTYRFFGWGGTGFTQIDSFTLAQSKIAAIGDFDGNSRDDIGLVSTTTNGLSYVRLSLPTGATLSSWTNPSNTPPTRVDAVDLDGDGADEWLEASYNGNLPIVIRIRMGGPTGVLAATPITGSTTFMSPMQFVQNYFIRFLPIDFDGDGARDIVIENWFETTREIVAAHFQPSATVPFVMQSVTLSTFPPRSAGGGSLPSLSTTDDSVIFPTFIDDFDGDGDPDEYQPVLNGFASGMIVRENLQRYGVGTVGATGEPILSNGPAIVGNAGFSMSIGSARPSATAFLLLSTARSATSTGILVDLTPTSLLTPIANLPIAFTDPAGSATTVLPIPNLPTLNGFAFFAQWAVLDPTGQFGIPGAAFALSRGKLTTIF